MKRPEVKRPEVNRRTVLVTGASAGIGAACAHAFAAAGATVIVVGHRDAVLAIGDEIVRAGGASRVHS